MHFFGRLDLRAEQSNIWLLEWLAFVGDLFGLGERIVENNTIYR